MNRTREKVDIHLSYLEVLDDEHSSLSGGAQEWSAARQRYRAAREIFAARDARSPADVASKAAALHVAESEFRREVLGRLHAARRAALCLSGGGIRSATFALGVLQGLAKRSRDTDEHDRPRLLGEFDYLSTVSGGGYVGAWFSAWSTRRSKLTPPVTSGSARLRDCGLPDLEDGAAAVIRHLARAPETGFDPEDAAIRHLRSYSNYLTPRLGLFSGDTWATFATVLRNIFLNWLVFVPLLATILLIPVGAREVVMAAGVTAQTQWLLLALGAGLGAVATGYIGFDLPSAGNARKPYTWYLWLCLLPVVLSAIHLTTFWSWLGSRQPDAQWWDVVALGWDGVTWMHFGVLGGMMHGGGMAIGLLVAMVAYQRPAPKIGLIATAAAVLTGFAAGAVAYTVAHASHWSGTLDLGAAIAYTCLAFPTLMAVFLLAGTLLVGATSYVTEDQDREWWARSGGLLLSITFAWLAFAALVLYGPDLLDRLRHWLGDQVGAVFTALTGLTGWGAARAGGSIATPSGRREDRTETAPLDPSRIRQYAAAVLPLVFLVLLGITLAIANRTLAPLLDKINPLVSLNSVAVFFEATSDSLWLAAVYLAVCLIASWFVNVNKFSLHGMYRERLIRAYLGASNEARDPHRFTGFDENDNISMCTLASYRPLHVVNMALNLVGGSSLAWQQRKAESFTCSRLHTGSCRVGYRPSSLYAGRHKNKPDKTPISLGTAITISGAAASPNMGYNSSPIMTLIMALFNARLGWWLGNPRHQGPEWKYPGPRFGVRPFIDEALGFTNEENTWIYLSDGGHFENLGVYEMVLRRCRFIVVCDAGADPGYAYEDLGNAVRKVRIDLGVSIDFTAPPAMSTRHAGRNVPGGHHCALAVIKYSAIDGTPAEDDGLLLYVKPSLTGDEPADVLHYSTQDTTFPQQSTADQFFDESQFESYRRLGMHIVERICEEHGSSPLDLQQFIEAGKKYVAGTKP
jgi:hypothetical protein